MRCAMPLAPSNWRTASARDLDLASDSSLNLEEALPGSRQQPGCAPRHFLASRQRLALVEDHLRLHRRDDLFSVTSSCRSNESSGTPSICSAQIWCPARSLDQLRRYADARFGSARASFQDILHAQLASDRSNVDGAAFEREHRAARNYTDGRYARQPGDDVLGQSVGKAFESALPLRTWNGSTARLWGLSSRIGTVSSGVAKRSAPAASLVLS